MQIYTVNHVDGGWEPSQWFSLANFPRKRPGPIKELLALTDLTNDELSRVIADPCNVMPKSYIEQAKIIVLARKLRLMVAVDKVADVVSPPQRLRDVALALAMIAVGDAVMILAPIVGHELMASGDAYLALGKLAGYVLAIFYAAFAWREIRTFFRPPADH